MCKLHAQVRLFPFQNNILILRRITVGALLAQDTEILMKKLLYSVVPSRSLPPKQPCLMTPPHNRTTDYLGHLNWQSQTSLLWSKELQLRQESLSRDLGEKMHKTKPFTLWRSEICNTNLTKPYTVCPGACFSKVPKFFGHISGVPIPFISSQHRGPIKPPNFPILLVFHTWKTC